MKITNMADPSVRMSGGNKLGQKNRNKYTKKTNKHEFLKKRTRCYFLFVSFCCAAHELAGRCVFSVLFLNLC